MTDYEKRAAFKVAMTSDNPTVVTMFHRFLVAAQMAHGAEIAAEVASAKKRRDDIELALLRF
ncbi:MAG: hypothetical protein ACLGIM_03655 [Alphaproteobacteria bacterium]